MVPQLYLEFPTSLLCVRAEEGFGRCYADTERIRLSWPVTIYPVPPDAFEGHPVVLDENNNPTYPNASGAPAAGAYTAFYTQCVRKPGGVNDLGGVLPLDDFMVGMLAPQTLSDGNSWSVDLETEPKTWAQLSPEAQAVVPEPEE